MSDDTDQGAGPRDPSRRTFFFQLGAGAAALVGLKLMPACEVIEVESKIAAARPDFVTPADDGIWYWQSGQGIAKEDRPQIAPEDWSLEVVDDDDQVLGTLDYDGLLAAAEGGAEISYWKTMRCVFGADVGVLFQPGFVANGLFTGVSLQSVLEGMGIADDVVKLRTFGSDGFDSNIPVERVLSPPDDLLPVILSYRLNAEPLSDLRGGPVRLIVPEMWGYKNMKWLERIQATADDSAFGNYETTKFPDLSIIDEPGEIALLSLVTRPDTKRNVELEGPDITISGVSMSGAARITDVEISLDDGPFEAIELGSEDDMLARLDPQMQPLAERAEQFGQPFPYRGVWVTWSQTFEGLEPGEHSVVVRASDSAGQTQDINEDPADQYIVQGRIRIPFTVV
jgi:DMSO/TMAO reductase YedYZ molybdopterin-dependent catalytic subunit